MKTSALKIVLLLAVACIVILAALAFITHGRKPAEPQTLETATTVAATAILAPPPTVPAVTTAQAPPPAPPPPHASADADAQMSEDAAAVGMATREQAPGAEASAPPAAPAPPPQTVN